MKKKVLFVILEKYAEWEAAFLASWLQGTISEKTTDYEVKTVSLSKSPVKSIGGFTTVPDYDLTDMPADYSGLFLIGGTGSWRTNEAKAILPIVEKALADGKVVGAICDATVFLGMNGLLNDRKHTSNALYDLVETAGDAYTNANNYVNEQVVCDGNLITANGTAAMEFAKEAMLALNAHPAEVIEGNYQFFKLGYTEVMKNVKEGNKA